MSAHVSIMPVQDKTLSSLEKNPIVSKKINSMLDFLTLQGSSENPTFVTILFTVVLAFLLSSVIAFTHDKTSRKIITPNEYLQSLILGSVVAATVMQAVGDSLARGLGIMGALAIIRFRTTLRSPRNMMFMFASLACGIACGVYGFVIASVGTLGFCAIAFILKYSPMSPSEKVSGILKLELPALSSSLENLETVLSNCCKSYAQVGCQLNQKAGKDPNSKLAAVTISYRYDFVLNNINQRLVLFSKIAEIDSAQSIKLDFNDKLEEV